MSSELLNLHKKAATDVVAAKTKEANEALE
jgi:hypothetical protein